MNRKPANTHGPACDYAALAVATISLMSVAPPAWAYLDPGTGSMIISAVVGLFATVGLAVKTYWYKIKSLLRKNTASPSSATGSADRLATDERAGEPAGEPERSTDS